MASRKRDDRGSNAGTVFWLAAIVIVLFIFALNWGKIQATLARTNFHEIVKTQTGTDTPAVPPAAPEAKPKAPATPSAPVAPAPVPEAQPKPIAPSAAKPSQEPAPKDSAQGAAAQGAAAQNARGANPKALVSVPTAKTRAASLYFVRIDDDGAIVRQEVKRLVSVSDSPLLDSLSALLQGPSEDELRKSLVSLVPKGTKLISAQVRGSTAYLNFNEAFMYNHYGIEGYAGQLKQVVYTSTAFPTVQDVQILIEGQKHDYLGGEGVYIGRPLSRNSF